MPSPTFLCDPRALAIQLVHHCILVTILCPVLNQGRSTSRRTTERKSCSRREFLPCHWLPQQKWACNRQSWWCTASQMPLWHASPPHPVLQKSSPTPGRKPEAPLPSSPEPPAQQHKDKSAARSSVTWLKRSGRLQSCAPTPHKCRQQQISFSWTQDASTSSPRMSLSVSQVLEVHAPLSFSG